MALNWAMIGGGEDSQIGGAHRIGANIDGRFRLVAGALDIDPQKGRRFAASLGVDPTRAYGNWRELLDAESKRDDRPKLVTIATPNDTHFEIALAFLEAGFHVFCEKPMTMDSVEGRQIVAAAKASRRICAVNYGYSGYPLVREMRARVSNGGLGAVRMVVAEFAHGFHADSRDADNPRLRWRYDPETAGQSAVLADCGIHALHMACFVTGQSVEKLSADFVSCVGDRQLEDDALVAFRMTGGTVGRLWTSAVAVGRMHGLTLQVFGEQAGMRWCQEQPNQLFYTPLGGATQVVERGQEGLSDIAQRACRVTIGHTEGMPEAFANLYVDLAGAIESNAVADRSLLPMSQDGLHSVEIIEAAVASAQNNGCWTAVGTPG